MPTKNWEDAKCVGQGDKFFPPDGSRKRDRFDEAKAICAACPLMWQCRDYAISSHMLYGVWGGLDEDELRSIALGRKHHN